MTAIPIQIAGFLPARGVRQDAPAPALRIARRRSARPAGEELPVTDRTDEQLLEAHLAGEAAAFRDLMDRYALELLHFLTRFLGSRAAAEDVFQETFLQIHLSAETFDPTRRFKPWLFTIAANKARDYHRKHRRRMSVSLSNTVGDDDDGQQFVDLMESDLPVPDQPIADAERSRLVKMIVDRLPEHLREILLLSYFQRMSYNQIADALQIPLGTVKSRLHTAVAAFAQAWKAQHQQGEGIT
jgi:RNA polymerase sigma-70 factor (ECF subfamily)